MTGFEDAANLGRCLAKDYAADMFRLLASYTSLSASEAASRLNLHVQTAQAFLDALVALAIVDKQESTDKTRPYFRYVLKVTRITLEVDLALLSGHRPDQALARLVRERRTSAARFVTSRRRNAVTTVVAWVGMGRDRDERRINLTRAQGAFLFHLPFPSEDPRPIRDILEDAAVEPAQVREVFDLLERLEALGAVDIRDP